VGTLQIKIIVINGLRNNTSLAVLWLPMFVGYMSNGKSYDFSITKEIRKPI
jgi:hypothetical protein